VPGKVYHIRTLLSDDIDNQINLISQGSDGIYDDAGYCTSVLIGGGTANNFIFSVSIVSDGAGYWWILNKY